MERLQLPSEALSRLLNAAKHMQARLLGRIALSRRCASNDPGWLLKRLIVAFHKYIYIYTHSYIYIYIFIRVNISQKQCLATEPKLASGQIVEGGGVRE